MLRVLALAPYPQQHGSQLSKSIRPTLPPCQLPLTEETFCPIWGSVNHFWPKLVWSLGGEVSPPSPHSNARYSRNKSYWSIELILMSSHQPIFQSIKCCIKHMSVYDWRIDILKETYSTLTFIWNHVSSHPTVSTPCSPPFLYKPTHMAI